MTIKMLGSAIEFMVYSYLGATLEHIRYFLSHERKALANPIITGFPLYGVGAFIVIGVHSKVQLGIVGSFLLYACLLTLLEYLVGKYITNAGKVSADGLVNSWNYNGRIISPFHFIAWGLLGTLVTYIHPKLSHGINYLIDNSKK